jgi:hypothetical protein
VSFLLISKQFLQTEKTASFIKMVSFANSAYQKEINSACFERNAINNLSLNSEMVSPMPITRLMLLEIINCETLEYNSHWTSRFEIYPKE